MAEFIEQKVIDEITEKCIPENFETVIKIKEVLFKTLNNEQVTRMQTKLNLVEDVEIGRASCRERV